MLSVDGRKPVTLPTPVAFWNANGNFIDAVSGNSATPLGGVSANTFGHIGQAFHFDGIDDAVNLGSARHSICRAA